MFDSVISVAFSGLRAAAERTAVVASNVANATDVSRLKPQQGDAPAFQPVQAVQTTITGGGVATSLQPASPVSVPVPEGNSPLTDANGLVALPNVDLGQQMVDLILAKTAFSANLKTIEVAQKMQKDLLKIDV